MLGVRIKDVAHFYQTSLCYKIPTIGFEFTNENRVGYKRLQAWKGILYKSSRGIIFKDPPWLLIVQPG